MLLEHIQSLALFCLITESYLGCCTVDLTLPELQHLANHLTKEECRKLVAALHFDTFKLDKNVENAENTVPEDVGCLKLLLHWNSSPNEGRGETHEKLSLRLRQIGRNDLAAWLDSAVLKELEEEINKTAREFKDYTNKEDNRENFYQENFDEEFIDDEFSWDFLEAVPVVIFVVIVCVTIFLLMWKVVQRFKFRRSNTKNEPEVKIMGSNIYEKISQQ